MGRRNVLAVVTGASNGIGYELVYAGSLKTKIEGKLANAVPGALKGAMHEKKARPVGEK